MTARVPALSTPYDSVYVSPHLDDVALACPGRLVREHASGQRILLVTLFAPGPHTAPAAGDALTGLGLEHLALDLPDARQRDARLAPPRDSLRPRGTQDEDVLHQAADVLTDLAHRTHARQVYAPLAVGGHIDHRLAHEAARAAFEAGQGRNVFLYEERPEAFVPGAVRIRLGQLGARLPPAAAEAPGAGHLGAYVLRFHVAPEFRGELHGRWKRIRSAWPALRQWRSGRSWHPLRALGPRLQPVTYSTSAADLPLVRGVGERWSGRLAALSETYARRLAGGAHAERYWLLLPPREADGAETLGSTSGVESHVPTAV
jgi:LmbE family N-acetylglucosaminyl deacetylase